MILSYPRKKHFSTFFPDFGVSAKKDGKTAGIMIYYEKMRERSPL